MKTTSCEKAQALPRSEFAMEVNNPRQKPTKLVDVVFKLRKSLRTKPACLSHNRWAPRSHRGRSGFGIVAQDEAEVDVEEVTLLVSGSSGGFRSSGFGILVACVGGTRILWGRG